MKAKFLFLCLLAAFTAYPQGGKTVLKDNVYLDKQLVSVTDTASVKLTARRDLDGRFVSVPFSAFIRSFVQSVTGNAVNNTDPLNPKIKNSSYSINAVQYPADMTFRPFPLFEYKGKYFTNITNRDLVKEKIDNLQPYYVGYAGASDSNNGLTKAASFATVNHAYSAGARLIYVAEGIYKEGNFGTITNTTSSDLIIIGSGIGKTVFTTCPDSVIWTLVSGATYSTPLTLATRVVDGKYVDAYGFRTELTKVTSQALCIATPGSKYVDTAANIVYAHLSDGRAPDADVLVLRHTVNAQYKGGTNYFYAEGITFMGGSDAFKSARNSPTTPTTKHVLMNKCAFIYAGGQEYNTGEGQGFACNEVPLSWAQDCTAYRNERDGFNYKGSAPTPKCIEIDCQSFLNGETSTESRINGSSAHTGASVIRLNGKYFSNYGPNVIDVDANLSNTGKGPALCLGVIAFDSRGYGTDSQYPTIADFAFVGGISKKAYLIGCTSLDTHISYAAISETYTGEIVVDQNSFNVSPYTSNVYFNTYTPGGGDKYIFPSLSTYTAKPESGTVTSVTGVSGETTVANGTTTPVIGISPTFKASKQDVLVAGTNIKTINGASPLGSGDIAVATITEYAETTYSDTPTWSGTAPTGITANWRGTKVGKHVSFRVNVTYSSPGAGITTLQLPFPTGLPTPSAITGYSTNNDYPIACYGFLNTGTSAQPPAARAFVRKTSTGYIINIVAASGAYSGAIVTVDYWTD